MKLISKIFKREKNLCQADLTKPFAQKAKEKSLAGDCQTAMAYLDCGIKLAPKALNLYMLRATMLQYQMNKYAEALSDYRFILRELESCPDDVLASQCRYAIKEMMELAPARA